jgi:hypothetical protein
LPLLPISDREYSIYSVYQKEGSVAVKRMVEKQTTSHVVESTSVINWFQNFISELEERKKLSSILNVAKM